MSSRRRRIWIGILAAAAILLLFFGRPSLHLAVTALGDRSDRKPVPAGCADDASRLECAPVERVVDIPADPAEAERQLVELVREARAKGLRISIAGARHTQGGHTISPGGLVLNMLPFKAATLDAERRLLKVQAGALWSDLLPLLDPQGLSVAVMQSDNAFSVGGSLSVNCHGWAHARPPIASTVDSLRVLTPAGEILACSRTERPELFSHVLGGYGLFGVILEAGLRVVPNEMLTLERIPTSVEKYAETLAAIDAAGPPSMLYGRICIAPDHFLRDAVITTARRAPRQPSPLPALIPGETGGLERVVFRGSVDSPYGKNLRWDAENRLQPWLESTATRNQMLNGNPAVYENRSEATTDILQEYFVAPDRLSAFVDRIREILPRHQADLLNLTVRGVRADPDTALRYADRDLLALVMYFHQARTPEADQAAAVMTRELIDAALALGGRYYLPYRLHATREQFAAAYPAAAAFFAEKRSVDPAEIFQNRFYATYGR